MTRKHLYIASTLPVFALAVAVSNPIAYSRKPTNLSPRQIASRASERTAEAAEETKADNLLLRGLSHDAFTKYEAINAKKPRPSVTLLMKIGTCHMIGGDYAKALATYRDAEDLGKKTGHPSATSGLIQSQTAYIAYLANDQPTVNSLVDSVSRAMSATPNDPTLQSPIDGPARTSNREAQAYVLFGRNLAKVFQRSGTDFAYKEALKSGGANASISYEYSRILSSTFHDTAAALRILNEINPGLDADLADSIRTDIINYSDELRSMHNVQNQSSGQYLSNLKLEAERTSNEYFSGFGIYDFVKSHPPHSKPEV